MRSPPTHTGLMKSLCLSGLIITVLSLAGCGQKGDLFVPAQDQQPTSNAKPNKSQAQKERAIKE